MTAAKTEPPATLAGALAVLQAAMPPVGKHATADVRKEGKKLYDYAYAPGETITPVLYPLMGALGLSFSAAPTFIADGHAGPRFVLDYRLYHVSGESTGGHYPLPDPDRYGPQDLGKAITYARRYALCALVGLFPGGDDNDANDVKPAATPAARRTTQRQHRAEHERIVHDTAGHDPAKTTRTKGQQVSGTDDDPWASDAPVNGERAAQLRETIPTSDPEDKPGSILPAQHRAIERLLSLAGIGLDDRVERHQYVKDTLGLDTLPPHPETGEPSIMGLSYTQAADVMSDLQRARQ